MSTVEPKINALESFPAADGAGMRYYDHDGDMLELSHGTYYDVSDIPVFYVKCVQEGEGAKVIRVPVDILLEMMDQIGIKVPL